MGCVTETVTRPTAKGAWLCLIVADGFVELVISADLMEYLMLERRTFLKLATSAAVSGIILPRPVADAAASSAVVTAPDGYKFKTPFYRLGLARTAPEITDLCFDSLGQGKLSINPILPNSSAARPAWHVTAMDDAVTYAVQRDGKTTHAGWTFKFGSRHIVIRSTAQAGVDLKPLSITFNQLSNYATLLGRMGKVPKQMPVPCLLHLPDLGTARITCNVDSVRLGYDAMRFLNSALSNARVPYVEITFPSATSRMPVVEYTLEITAIYPHLPGIDKDSLYDGYRRNFLNIFQINPRLRVLANNSSSDVCACTLYEYAMVAAKCPPLADGLTCLDIVRDTLDRYCDGMLAYGLVGYPSNYEGAPTLGWGSPYDELDALPSLLIGACTYIQASGDWKWAAGRFANLIAWSHQMLDSAHSEHGLIEYPLSGNHGCYSTGDPIGGPYRPSNWWDTVGFGHQDAYANALAYRACAMMAELAKHLGRNTEAAFFQQRAGQIRAVYHRTFYNPQTGLLAGWKSSDGQLHDYQFIFVNSVAVWSGVLDQRESIALMRQVLNKMAAAGYTYFELGLPGNLIPVANDDYILMTNTRWGDGGTRGFQKFENGGASACFCYFTIEALFRTGMIASARRILYPMLRSFEAGAFQGFGRNGNGREWKSWKGVSYGYEGFLVDGYLTLLAVLTDRAVVTGKKVSKAS